jgi:hypothetical protein
MVFLRSRWVPGQNLEIGHGCFHIFSIPHSLFILSSESIVQAADSIIILTINKCHCYLFMIYLTPLSINQTVWHIFVL